MNAQSGSAELARMIDAASAVVAFTGAGISTECGIPDFRSKDSAWTRHPPMPFDDFLASEDNRVLAWRRKFAMDDLHRDVRPGRGHRALARLMASGKVIGVITQNIDGLHQAAGSPERDVVELHGNGGYALCLACGVRHEIARVRAQFEIDGRAPRCLCGGMVKSATISFGQSMPADAMSRARELTLRADLFLAIGSSLVVHPAAAFPAAARQNGARLAILNREPTRLDAIADLVLRADIGDALDPLGR
jgi:NAD-dependent deacetylase